MTEANQTTANQPLVLSEGAVEAIKNILIEQDIPDGYGLRVGVKGGGCSGFSYVLGFDERTEKDDVFEIEGINVLIEKVHFMYLAGMEIDWVDGLENRGFSFNNPSAKSTCGCGSSFEV